MTLWRDFQRSQPRVAQSADIAFRSVQPRVLPDARSYRNLGLSEMVADIAADPSTVELGIYGLGAWISDSGALVPALFVLPGMVPAGGAPLPQSELNALVPPQLRAELADVAVIPLAQPSSYATTLSQGAAITVGSRNATAGIWVKCRHTAKTGFLTAGHAAPTTNVIARDRGGVAVGTVLRTIHRGVGAGVAPVADVAMVETYSSVSSTGSPLPITSVAPQDQIALQVAHGASTSWIRGLSPSFAVSPQSPTWGEVGITADAISVAGDSGAAVTASGHVVAHLVGGAPHDYSVVQDVEYQLAEIDADPI